MFTFFCLVSSFPATSLCAKWPHMNLNYSCSAKCKLGRIPSLDSTYLADSVIPLRSARLGYTLHLDEQKPTEMSQQWINNPCWYVLETTFDHKTSKLKLLCGVILHDIHWVLDVERCAAESVESPDSYDIPLVCVTWSSRLLDVKICPMPWPGGAREPLIRGNSYSWYLNWFWLRPPTFFFLTNMFRTIYWTHLTIFLNY